MNRNKQYIYNFKENAPKPKKIDLWLNKYKPRELTMIETYKKCFDIEIKPKHRHRRSIAQRKLHRLFSCLVVRMGYAWLKDDEGIAPVDYPCPKDKIWKECRRLWIRE